MLTGDSGISNSSFWLPPPLQPKDLIFCAESQLIKMFSCPDDIGRRSCQMFECQQQEVENNVRARMS
jgi:hypothetical protein